MRHAAVLLAALSLSLAATAALQAGIAPSPFTVRLGVEPSPFVPPGGQLRFKASITNTSLPGTVSQKLSLAVRGEGWSSDVRNISCPKPGGTSEVRFATAYLVPIGARPEAKLTFQLVDATSRAVPPKPLCAPAVAVVRASVSVATHPAVVPPTLRPERLVLPDLQSAVAVFRDKACTQPVTGDFTAKGPVTLYVLFSVKNVSRGAAGAFQSVCRVSSNDQGHQALWPKVDGLAAGGHFDFPLIEYVVKAPSNQVECLVAADQLLTVAESSETNNRASRKLTVTIRP